MYKKTLNFTDFDGNLIQKDYYFNLSKPDLLRLDASTPGGLFNKLSKLNAEKDVSEVFNIVETLITEAYGEKGDDGISFIKVRNGVKLGEQFRQTMAYDALVEEMLNNKDGNAEEFNNFIYGVMPSDLVSQAKIEQQKFLAQKHN